MASKAWSKFNKNAEDIDSLLDLWEGVVNLWDKEPVPNEYEVLFRSAVVLMVSHWEAYVEDICSEALDHLVSHVEDASKLPKDIKKLIAGEIKKKDHELEMWKLADSGWKEYLRSRLVELKRERDRHFNTPKAHNTAEFLIKAIGVDPRPKWKTNELTADEVAKKLDDLIEIRGQIAHRGEIDQKIDQQWVAEHVALLRHVASWTGGAINSHLLKVTRKPLWVKKKSEVKS